MSLLKTLLVWIAVSCILWMALTCLPAVIKIFAGQATGIAFKVPSFPRGPPMTLQVVLTLLGIPVLIGSFGGSLCYFVQHR